ncbi:MAG: PAS domain S-box protein [Anaerolineales bacterium]|nr:PAS domain S-box protein [Anaerolineales bacterium]
MQKSNLGLHEQAYRQIFESASDAIIIIDLETSLVIDANPAACSMHDVTREEFIGQQLAMYIHPESQPDFELYLQTAHSGSAYATSIKHIFRDGQSFDAEWHRTVLTFNGRLCALGIVRDVSKRIQAEQLLKKQMETRTHEQETLLEISHTLASTLQLQPDLILEKLREIIEFSHGGLFVVENSSLVTLAMLGTPLPELSLPLRIHLQGLEILAGLFRHNHPVRIADVRGDSPEAKALNSLLNDGAAVLLKGMQSWMWVPLAVKNRIFGCFGVAHEIRDHFSPHHADLALSVANQAAITMANAELYEQAQTLAAFEERQRLARNLHDAINQSLFSASIIADVMPRLWERDQEQVHRSLGDLRRLIRGAQAEMRALLAELRPATLTDSELDDLIHLLGNALSGWIDIPVIIKAPEKVALPAEVQIAFYRVCQEALNNVAKHAKASLVEITLTHDDVVTELRIRDNGHGFDPEQTNPGHYGLKMMRERTEAIGGQLSVTSQPGHGTELVVRWINPSRKETP